MKHRLQVFAPATIANLGPGFDVLGLALNSPGDTVEAELTAQPGVEIVEITGDGGFLSRDADKNVIGRAASAVLRRAGSNGASQSGVRLWLHKQMPLASGLGSSGASSAAAALAVNELLERPLGQNDILLSAIEGETAASGTPHADNVAPSLLGGIVLVRSYEPLEVLQLPVPENLHVAVVHPHCQVSTSEARTLVKNRTYALDDIVANLGNISAFVVGLFRNDLTLVGRSIHDRLIEPLRAKMIPGFADVTRVAIEAGGLGCSIAGSGPSVFAFGSSASAVQAAGMAMQSAFKLKANLASDLFVGKINREGAHVIQDKTKSDTKTQSAATGEANWFLPGAPERPKRVTVTVTVRYRQIGEENWHVGRTENISLAGVLIRGGRLFTENVKVEILMTVPPGIVTGAAGETLFEGKVARLLPPPHSLGLPGVAIAFERYRPAAPTAKPAAPSTAAEKPKEM